MRRHLALVLAAAAVLGAGRGWAALGDEAAVDGPLPPAPPATVPGYDQDPLSLLGPTRVGAAQLVAFVARDRQTRTTVPLGELARIFVEEGAAFGVRADIAWVQSIVETGWFGFEASMVEAADNNFAGLGACDSCSRGRIYASARAGVRAQMQLLRGYADPDPPTGYALYPPKSYRGAAPTWWQMGNGHWATSTRYASAVIGMYGRLLDFAGVDLSYSPPPGSELASAVDAAPPEPQPRAGDGLYLADVAGQVYDVGDARFWGSAYRGGARADVVAVASTPRADGYWLFTANGGVLPFGSARALGAPGTRIAAGAAVPYGQGYWTVTARGVVRGFGAAARLEPAPGAVRPDARVVGIAPTRTGSGFWLVDSRGRVYAFGDARGFGDLADPKASDPVVGLAPTPWDDGYWLATASGRVVGFGAAEAVGGLADELADDADRRVLTTAEQRRVFGALEAAKHLVVAIRPSPTGLGYWLVTADGLVVGRGDAPDFGDVQQTGVPVLAATSRLDAAPPYRPGTS